MGHFHDRLRRQHRAGTVTVNSGNLLSSSTYIGYGGTATGVVNISGTGSTWADSGGLYAGSSGSGTLNITNGGSVSNTTAYIGRVSGAAGTVTVDGNGSTWTNGTGGVTAFTSEQQAPNSRISPWAAAAS